MDCWRFHVSNFDNDQPGGRQLNADLRDLASKHGQDFIRMEASFPSVNRLRKFWIRVPPFSSSLQHLEGGREDEEVLKLPFGHPQDYPTMPFFVRILTPRCCFYTGHVTAGGSICIEALVNTGGPGGWQVG